MFGWSSVDLSNPPPMVFQPIRKPLEQMVRQLPRKTHKTSEEKEESRPAENPKSYCTCGPGLPLDKIFLLEVHI